MLIPDLGNALISLHRGHPGRRGRMACQPCPQQHTWLQRAPRQPQGQGGREKKTLRCLRWKSAHGVCNEVWWRPFPTNLPPPNHHCQTPERTRVRTSFYFSDSRLTRHSSHKGESTGTGQPRQLVTLMKWPPLQPQLWVTGP